MLFDENVLEQRMPDNNSYDNHINATELPVRNVHYLTHSITCTRVSFHLQRDLATLWCGSHHNTIYSIDITPLSFQNLQTLEMDSCSEASDAISHLCTMEVEGASFLWSVTGSSRFNLWNITSHSTLVHVSSENYTTDDAGSEEIMYM